MVPGVADEAADSAGGVFVSLIYGPVYALVQFK